MILNPFFAALNATLDGITRAGSLLVLPLSLLLFAQWPLRDVIGTGSRPANDLAQWIFALYVALALRHTTRARAHMAADTFALRYPHRIRERIRRIGPLVCVLPWSLFVLASSTPMVWQSLRSLESFPDTLNPLYFVIKISVWLLALMMSLQVLADGFDASGGA